MTEAGDVEQEKLDFEGGSKLPGPSEPANREEGVIKRPPDFEIERPSEMHERWNQASLAKKLRREIIPNDASTGKKRASSRPR